VLSSGDCDVMMDPKKAHADAQPRQSSAEAHYDRANALFDLGRYDLAIKEYDAAIHHAQDHVPARNNRGLALCSLGEYEAGVASFDGALRIQPANAEAHHFRGKALSAMRQYAAAIDSYDRAIALDDGDAEVHNSRGSALAQWGKYPEALASYGRALELRPQFPEAHSNKANVLAELRCWPEALAGYDRALTLKPDFIEAHINRGNALGALDQLEAAVAGYGHAIALAPDHTDALRARGLALARLGRCGQAMSDYARALEINPNDAKTHVNRALLRLRLGDYAEGWSEFDWRWMLTNDVFHQEHRSYAQPRWTGIEPLAGKTLFLHSEQGLGDNIQFCRYVPLLAASGAKVVLEAHRPLHTLLSTLDGVAQTVVRGEAPPPFDYYCPLLSVPAALRTTLSDIPSHVPYIKCDAAKTRHWKERLGECTAKRVGLVWSGGFRPDQPEFWSANDRRNIPLAKLAALKMPGLEFYSLQKGETAEAELAHLIDARWDGPPILDHTGDLHDFSDTAALISQMDLTISVDTSVAHLAGALGRPVWILNRFDSCWRWLMNRSDSPWYPTARLYGQQIAGDWDGVLSRVRVDLERWRRGSL
jgi:tetratricopeptide (TPR) repeat protein